MRFYRIAPFLLAVAVSAQTRVGRDGRTWIEEKETITRSFPATPILDIDNVHGSIEVTVHSGNTIEVVANKTLRAEAQDLMEEARKEVKLDVQQNASRLVLYVDGPFRCEDGGVRSRRRRGYHSEFDFIVKVPEKTELRLSTVNGGDVKVQGTASKFDVSNVNGAVRLTDVAGSGYVSTVNGGIEATFRRNPDAATSFKTVNGTVEARFTDQLAADLAFKTFNGGVYTDYEVTARPLTATAPERRNGKFVYRGRDFAGARVGAGGPEIRFETLNGNIRVLKR